jgi:hypothetical protein
MMESSLYQCGSRDVKGQSQADRKIWRVFRVSMRGQLQEGRKKIDRSVALLQKTRRQLEGERRKGLLDREQ